MNPFFAALHAKGLGNIAIRSRTRSGFETTANAEQAFPPMDSKEIGPRSSAAEAASSDRSDSAPPVKEADSNLAMSAKEGSEHLASPIGVPMKHQSSPVVPADFGLGRPLLRQQEGMTTEPLHPPADALPTTRSQRHIPANRATVDQVISAAVPLWGADRRPVDTEAQTVPERRTVGARTNLSYPESDAHTRIDDEGIAAVEYRELRMALAQLDAPSILADSQRLQSTAALSKTRQAAAPNIRQAPGLNREVAELANSAISPASRAESFPDNVFLETPSLSPAQRQAVGRSDDYPGVVERPDVLTLAGVVSATRPSRRAPEIAAEESDKEHKITVEIGRLEIRDQRRDLPPPQRAKPARLGLSEYLERRLGRGRDE